MFNAFNVLNGLVLGFCNRLKSNGLENLMDQRLTEVTFKSNDAQLRKYHHSASIGH